MLIHLLKDHSQITEEILQNDISMPKNAFDNATSLYYKGYLSKRQEEVWKKVLFMVDYAKVNTRKKQILIPSANKITRQLELNYKQLLKDSAVFEN